MTQPDFASQMPGLKRRFEQKLLERVQASLPPGKLGEAITYATAPLGKRIRPLLCYGTAASLSLPMATVDAPAVAVELVHTYSLVHDDLPAMDDDDLRRGRATLHRAFDEATAILVGDALQSLAFEALAAADAAADVRLRWLKELAAAAGGLGMVQGQALDLAGEASSLDLDELTELHRLKTGKMITLAIRLAAAPKQGLEASHLERLSAYGDRIGLAFQVKDDILDITTPTDKLGKPQGSDAKQGKATFASLLGLEGATAKLNDLLAEAEAALGELPFDTSALRTMAHYIVNREF
ncbi:MAG: polyprenyl synthetase family protein [Pseudomonadales bacterium]